MIVTPEPVPQPEWPGRNSDDRERHLHPHQVLDRLDATTKPLENLYCDLHHHPKLWTRSNAPPPMDPQQLEWVGINVSTGTGGAGVSRNGDDAILMLRVEMDAAAAIRGSILRPKVWYWRCASSGLSAYRATTI